jgi:hypothetical protein
MKLRFLAILGLASAAVSAAPPVLFIIITVSMAHVMDWRSAAAEDSYSCHEADCFDQVQNTDLLRLCEEMRSRARWASDWQCQNTAIFDNGSPVESIVELRAKSNPEGV